MILIILLILVTSAFNLQVKGLTYYITPDNSNNGTCTFNGSTLEPCYQLPQVSITSRISSVNLLLLPGIHVIPGQQNLTYNGISIKMASLNISQVVKIHCQRQTELLFTRIGNLRISSLYFIACTLKIVGSLYADPVLAYGLKVADCIFTNNSHDYSIIIRNMDSISINRSLFFHNSGAIWCESEHSNTKLGITDTIFQSHWGANNGSALHIQLVNLKISNSLFINNTGLFGGAVFAEMSHIIVFNTLFKDNYSKKSGGAIYYEQIFKSIAFSMNNVSFISNKAGLDGGAVYCWNRHYSTILLHMTESILLSNLAKNGGFAFLLNCSLQVSSEIDIINNTATATGGAVFAVNSRMIFDGLFFNISWNSAVHKGGAFFLKTVTKSRYDYYIIFILRSSIEIEWHMTKENHTKVLFSNNAVISKSGKGGAIFVEDDDCENTPDIYHWDPFSGSRQDTSKWKPSELCFLYEYKPNSVNNKYFIFENNTAGQGSVIYGGLLDRCLPPIKDLLVGNHFLNGIDAFKANSHYEQTPLAISSRPMKACVCVDDHKPNCSIRQINVTKMRGEIISVSIAAVDQDNNPVSSTIIASYNEESVILDRGEERKNITSNICKTLDYHIFTVHDSIATLVLEPVGPCKSSPLSIHIHINVASCGKGFEQDMNTCDCERRLKTFNIDVCNIDTHSITRKGSIWLRYDEHYLKIHTNCPLDFCNIISTNISIQYPDDQCVNNHSGILCGGCRESYSIVFGGSRCLQCLSKHTFIWLTLTFIIAGMALIALLLIFNLTISHGSLNGLIFYANVVSIGGLTSVSNCSIHPILTVFIAWLNLDLGIETCFYPGMDSYVKTWLQFVFPLYVWLLVGAIILASHYSSRAMKIFGRNNIAILATLFLLSYNKILKTIITALTFTEIQVSQASNVSDSFTPDKVWFFDGNVDYVKGKHIFLFAVSLAALVLLFLPYTLMLIFGQWLRSLPLKRKCLRWIRGTAFISIMDAYHAPYNKKHRYWTGLMLLIRCFLFLVFAASYKDNALLTNSYAIALVTWGTLTIKVIINKVYKNKYMNMLELSFLLNLGIVSATLIYLKGKNERASALCACVSVSVSISLVTFIGILAYHTYLQVRNKTYYLSVKQAFMKRFKNKEITCTTEESTVRNDQNLVHTKKPTTTSVELREPLLENVEMEEK